MKNPVSTYNQFQAMEVVEPAAAIHAQLNPGKKKQP